MNRDETLDQHAQMLARVAAGYLVPGPDRDDLVQDILLACWRALPQLREAEKARAFLLRVAHNRAMSFIVRRRTTNPLVEEPVSLVASPEQRAAQRQEVDTLLDAVRTLAPGLRQAITLKLEGLDNSEIAMVLGTSTEAAAVRIHRARKALKTAMEKRHGR